MCVARCKATTGSTDSLPARQHATALHANGLPIGTPTKDSPFAGAASFTPLVVVRNLVASAQEVTVTVEYRGEKGAEQTVLPPLSLGAYATQDLSLDSLMGQLPLPLPYCSIRIQYSGPPGSAMAEVSSIEQNGDLVVDSKLANEGDGSAGSGGNPWHLDAETESTLFLANMSDRNVRIGLHLQANGAHYFLTKLRLNPHETRAIDLRKLRDAQEPDFRGNRIPANASDGSVLWAKFENLPVMGQMMVVQRHQGMASSYSCFPCSCGPVQSFVSVSVTPSTVTGIPGDTQQFICTERKDNCNGTQFFYDVTGSALWASSATDVATVNSTGFSTAVGPGTANIGGSFTDTQYSSDCTQSQTTNSDFATCSVCDFRISGAPAPANCDGITGNTTIFQAGGIPTACRVEPTRSNLTFIGDATRVAPDYAHSFQSYDFGPQLTAVYWVLPNGGTITPQFTIKFQNVSRAVYHEDARSVTCR